MNFKNLISIMAALLMCLATITIVHAEETKMYVNTDWLNVRSTPTAANDNNIIKSVSFGNWVVKTGVSGDWTQIRMADGRTAYMKSSYLSTTRPTAKTTATGGSKGQLLFYANRVSHYCPCGICNPGNAGRTASGKPMKAYYTCACNGLPLGTKIYVEGYGVLEVQDRMSSRYGSQAIDVLVGSHSEAYAKGVKKGVAVYRVS